MIFDLIIKNAEIYDGSGNSSYISDIGIKDDKILKIAKLEDVDAKEVIDAKGFVVMPGFIDVHTHSDIALINEPQREQALLQGITTEITSACGIGCVPLSNLQSQYIDTVRAITGTPLRTFDSSSLSAFFSEIDKEKTGVNVATQLAHSSLRAEVLGFGDVPFDERMLEMADKIFSQGACGFSTGLAYYPASYSDTDEIIKIGKVVQKYDLPVCFHQRTALRDEKSLFNSREELLEVARSGVRVHFSHYRTTPATAGQLDELLEPIERGIKEGLNITADFYPYQVGSGYLAVLLPFGIMNGSTDDILKTLINDDGAIRKQFSIKAKPFLNAVVTEADDVTLLGKSFETIAKERGKKTEDIMFELLISERLNVGYHLCADFSEEQLKNLELDFVELIKKPYYMVGSDTLPLNKFPHPRTYGAFAKMCRIAIKHNLGLDIIANRMCSKPAKLFKLKNRGEIKENNFADIIIFDKNTFGEASSFDNPKEYAKGMKYVIVNGKIAVSCGKITGVRAGNTIKAN